MQYLSQGKVIYKTKSILIKQILTSGNNHKSIFKRNSQKENNLYFYVKNSRSLGKLIPDKSCVPQKSFQSLKRTFQIENPDENDWTGTTFVIAVALSGRQLLLTSYQA